jgi:hypothetical protein
MYALILAALITPAFALDATGSPNYAMVRGAVIYGHRPLGNVRVLAYGDAGVQETKTDTAGRYYFMTLLPGIYRIYVPTSVGAFPEAGPGSVLVGPKGIVVGTKQLNLRRCIEEHNDTFMELIAGQLYKADIQLAANC